MSQLQRFTTAAAAILCAAGAALGDTVVYSLNDHPGGGGPAALRFDNLFTMLGGSAGLATFSLAPFNDAVMTVDGGRVTIEGTVYGGLAGGYGEGAYHLRFTFGGTGAADASGIVGPAAEADGLTLTAAGDNNGVAAGTMFVLGVDEGRPGAGFEFLRDGFRLTDAQRAAMNDPYIGRGWLLAPNVDGSLAEFIFTCHPPCMIPLPQAAVMAAAGLMPLAVRRRRR